MKVVGYFSLAFLSNSEYTAQLIQANKANESPSGERLSTN